LKKKHYALVHFYQPTSQYYIHRCG